jgi:hypothetical protein
MHLVHGFACLVEELQRAAYLLAVALFDRKSVRPDSRENPEVDVGAEHEGGMIAGMDLVVDADLFMDRAFVARQRHDFADRFQPH